MSLHVYFLQFPANHHSFNFDPRKGPVHVEWFQGGTTNVCYNALDRWVQVSACSTRVGICQLYSTYQPVGRPSPRFSYLGPAFLVVDVS